MQVKLSWKKNYSVFPYEIHIRLLVKLTSTVSQSLLYLKLPIRNHFIKSMKEMGLSFRRSIHQTRLPDCGNMVATLDV